MNTCLPRRSSRLASALVCALALAAAGHAQTVPTPLNFATGSAKENWISVSTGYSSISGNEAAFQRLRQNNGGGMIGIDAWRTKNDLGNNATFSSEGRANFGEGDYLARLRWENSETGVSLEGGFRRSTVYYDGSAGYFPINGQFFKLFHDELSIARSEFWLQAAIERERWSGKLRVARLQREGLKDSTSWADSNLTGIPGTVNITRGIVPSFLAIDETRTVVSADIAYKTEKNTTGGGVRIEDTEIDNSRNTIRRPTESAQRPLTQREGSESDLFSMHAFSESRFGEKLHLSAASSYTKIDTNMTGSRIYGSAWGVAFDPNFPRQSRDEGFYDLAGDSQWKQFLLTGNALYTPAPGWRLNGGLRFENQRQDVISEFVETNFVAPNTRTADELEGESSRDIDELLGSLEASYTGIANWTFTGFYENAKGDGDLREDLLDVEINQIEIARHTGFDRYAERYGVNARWYPTPHLNFAAAAVRKVRTNDYTTSEDTTPPTGGDRYPAFIEWQRFTIDDYYVRGTWRPATMFSCTGRYDYTSTDLESREAGLPSLMGGEMKAHILSGTFTLTPLDRVFVQAGVNIIYDDIITGLSGAPGRIAGRFDNNYTTSHAMVVVNVDDKSDVQAEYYSYHAGNYRDVSAITVPFGLTATNQTASLTYTRRVNEDLLWSLRYAYGTYSDVTSGGKNDFDSNFIYGRIQLRY